MLRKQSGGQIRRGLSPVSPKSPKPDEETEKSATTPASMASTRSRLSVSTPLADVDSMSESESEHSSSSCDDRSETTSTHIQVQVRFATQVRAANAELDEHLLFLSELPEDFSVCFEQLRRHGMAFVERNGRVFAFVSWFANLPLLKSALTFIPYIGYTLYYIAEINDLIVSLQSFHDYHKRVKLRIRVIQNLPRTITTTLPSEKSEESRVAVFMQEVRKSRRRALNELNATADELDTFLSGVASLTSVYEGVDAFVTGVKEQRRKLGVVLRRTGLHAFVWPTILGTIAATCQGLLPAISPQGRTVEFVSHYAPLVFAWLSNAGTNVREYAVDIAEDLAELSGSDQLIDAAQRLDDMSDEMTLAASKQPETSVSAWRLWATWWVGWFIWLVVILIAHRVWRKFKRTLDNYDVENKGAGAAISTGGGGAVSMSSLPSSTATLDESENRAGARRAFDMFDADGSGTIDSDEFKVLAEACQLNMSDEEVMNTFKTIDKDGSGEIDFDEFWNFWLNLSSAPSGAAGSMANSSRMRLAMLRRRVRTRLVNWKSVERTVSMRRSQRRPTPAKGDDGNSAGDGDGRPRLRRRSSSVQFISDAVGSVGTKIRDAGRAQAQSFVEWVSSIKARAKRLQEAAELVADYKVRVLEARMCCCDTVGQCRMFVKGLHAYDWPLDDGDLRALSELDASGKKDEEKKKDE